MKNEVARFDTTNKMHIRVLLAVVSFLLGFSAGFAMNTFLAG